MPRLIRRNMLAIAFAFILCGVLHVLLYKVSFFDCFVQFYCGTILIFWAASVKKRVTDRRLCRIMLMIVGLILFHMLLQICRYIIFCYEYDIYHYLWYLYYVPSTALPVLCLYLAALVHREEREKVPKVVHVTALAALLMMTGVLTNDLHFWFKLFPEGLNAADNTTVSGWLFYLIYAFQFSVYALSISVFIYKSRVSKGQKYRWLPFLSIALGIIYCLLYPLDLDAQLFRCRIWNMTEFMAFCLMAALEGCIQTGLIPANIYYDMLFPLIDFPVVIYDRGLVPAYVSGDTSVPMRMHSDSRIRNYPITGGSVEWKIDLSRVNRLNRELEVYTQRIAARNEYLSEEAGIKEKKSRLETRNRIYERIMSIVRPQLDLLNTIMDDPQTDPERKLQYAAILCAFIKRRSNMEFLAENGRITSEELVLAVSESLEYLRLGGMEAAVSASGSAEYSSEMLTEAYELLEKIVEGSMAHLSGIMVSLRFEEKTFSLRILLNASTLNVPPEEGDRSGEGFFCLRTFTKMDDDLLLVYQFREGGTKD